MLPFAILPGTKAEEGVEENTSPVSPFCSLLLHLNFSKLRRNWGGGGGALSSIRYTHFMAPSFPANRLNFFGALEKGDWTIGGKIAWISPRSLFPSVCRFGQLPIVSRGLYFLIDCINCYTRMSTVCVLPLKKSISCICFPCETELVVLILVMDSMIFV